jgi:hypothetical protein
MSGIHRFLVHAIEGAEPNPIISKISKSSESCDAKISGMVVT